MKREKNVSGRKKMKRENKEEEKWERKWYKKSENDKMQRKTENWVMIKERDVMRKGDT
jgi:hypothetical protein